MKLHSLTPKEAIRDIQNGKLFLPPIQRDFVWRKDKILALFDSLYRSYPINNFIFWKLLPETSKLYPLHKFTTSVAEKIHQHKEPAPRHLLNEDIWAVVDGQQRLSSMFIGVAGTYRYKKGKGRNVESNLITSRLYFNLFEASRDPRDEEYFDFLSEDDADFINDSQLWFELGKIIGWGDFDLRVAKQIEELEERVKKTNKKTAIRRWLEQKEVICNRLHRLYQMVNSETINYLEIEEQNIDEVVEMFTRVNAGGMILKKSDLLFSTLVAMWPEGQEEIDTMVAALGDSGIKVSKDFVMRTCIMLSDLPVKYRLESFNKKNIKRIKENWEEIKQSLNTMIELLPAIGYNYQRGLSENALIPIAYYIKHGGKVNSQKARKNLQLYYTVSQIKGIFGGQGDAVLDKIRSEISNQLHSSDTMDFENLKELRLPGGKSFSFSESDLEDLVYNTSYFSPHAYFILSLLYPSVDFKVYRYQVDHAHPRSKFNRSNLISNGIQENLIDKWIEEKRDLLPNLQLLAGVDNNNKKSRTLLDYLKEKKIADRRHFLTENLLPTWIQKDLMELSRFEDFFEWRAQRMVKKLKGILTN